MDVKGKLVSQDEEPHKLLMDKVTKLKPSFPDKNKEGTITPANASKLNDGACILLLTGEKTLSEQGLSAEFEILGWGDAESMPIDFNITPALAAKKALQMAKLQMNQVDFWEVNEAFSVTALVNKKLLELNDNQLNVNGGAVSLGHPIGASGARIILSLMSVLREKGGKIGVATICNGGGGATAIVLRNLNA